MTILMIVINADDRRAGSKKQNKNEVKLNSPPFQSDGHQL